MRKDLRVAYLSSLGFREVQTINALEAVLKENEIDKIKLTKICEHFQVPAQYRSKVWKIMLGVLPEFQEAWEYTQAQKEMQYNDLKQASEIVDGQAHALFHKVKWSAFARRTKIQEAKVMNFGKPGFTPTSSPASNVSTPNTGSFMNTLFSPPNTSSTDYSPAVSLLNTSPVHPSLLLSPEPTAITTSPNPPTSTLTAALNPLLSPPPTPTTLTVNTSSNMLTVPLIPNPNNPPSPNSVTSPVNIKELPRTPLDPPDGYESSSGPSPPIYNLSTSSSSSVPPFPPSLLLTPSPSPSPLHDTDYSSPYKSPGSTPLKRAVSGTIHPKHKSGTSLSPKHRSTPYLSTSAKISLYQPLTANTTPSQSPFQSPSITPTTTPPNIALSTASHPPSPFPADLDQLLNDAAQMLALLYRTKRSYFSLSSSPSSPEAGKIDDEMCIHGEDLYKDDSGHITAIAKVFCATCETETDAFWCFHDFLNQPLVTFGHRSTGIYRHISILQRLLEANDAELWQHFKVKDLRLEQFAYCWFKSYFASCFQMTSLYLIWDKIIGLSMDCMPHIALAMLQTLRRRILRKPDAQSIAALLTYPNLTIDTFIHKAIDLYAAFPVQNEEYVNMY